MFTWASAWGQNGYLPPLEIEAKNQIFLKTCSQLLIQINWFTSCNDCLFAYISGVGGVSVSALPKVLMRWKSRQNSWKSAKSVKIWAKSVKTLAKSLKIWTNSMKIRAKMASNALWLKKSVTQRALIWKYWPPTCAESHENFFYSENVLREKIFSQKWPKIFSGKFEEIRAKILPTP